MPAERITMRQAREIIRLKSTSISAHEIPPRVLACRARRRGGAQVGLVAKLLNGRERPRTRNWFTPPANRIGALDATCPSTATGPSGSRA